MIALVGLKKHQTWNTGETDEGRQEEYWGDRRTAARRGYKTEEVVQRRAYPRGHVESACTEPAEDVSLA